jgi:hypothetical protein
VYPGSVTLSSLLYRSGQILFFRASSHIKTAIFPGRYFPSQILFFGPFLKKTLFSEAVSAPDSATVDAAGANHRPVRSADRGFPRQISGKPSTSRFQRNDATMPGRPFAAQPFKRLGLVASLR